MKYFYFWITFLYTAAFALFLYYVSNKNIPYPARFPRSKDKIRFLNALNSIILKIVALTCALIILFPMAMDFPNAMLDRDTQQITGVIQTINTPAQIGSVIQVVTLNNTQYSVFYNVTLKKGEKVQLSFLPHSHFVIKIAKFS